MTAPQRILVVGMHNSPHLHRWVDMIAGPDVAVIVFPGLSFPGIRPASHRVIRLSNVNEGLEAGIYVLSHEDSRRPEDLIADEGWSFRPLTHSFVDAAHLSTSSALQRCIDRFRPSFLHSMETQIAGYLCAETARRSEGNFPFWIHSTWGSDLFLFQKLAGHPKRLRNVFENVKFHLADCHRDRMLARRFGYRGPEMPIIPASGGMNIGEVAQLAGEPPSRRKLIMLKGYHNWAGRALLGLSAIELVRDRLRDFTIGVLTPSARVRQWADEMRGSGLAIELFTYHKDHSEALRRLAQARLVIGLSISDGLPTTVLEAMALGVFPVQSDTGCCSDWIQDGRTGFIVSPSNTREIASAIVRAATDDNLVDSAATANLDAVRQRWDIEKNARLAWEVYDRALASSAAGNARSGRATAGGQIR